MLKVPLNPSSLAVRSIFCFIGRALKCTSMSPPTACTDWLSTRFVAVTHRRRADLADASFFSDWTDFVDESERIAEFFPAGLEDRALRRRLELVRPRSGHCYGSKWTTPDEQNSLQSICSVVLFRKAASSLHLPTVSISRQTSTREAAHTHPRTAS